MKSINQLNYKTPEKSHATDELACCSKHILCINTRLFLLKSYEAGVELLSRRACDFLSVELGVMERMSPVQLGTRIAFSSI